MAAAMHSSAAAQGEAHSFAEVDDAAEFSLPKLVVFGGNGYVGSHVCQAGIRMGVPVVSVNRSGRPGNADTSWADQVDWQTGDAADPSTYKHLFANCMGVVSCVGAFGSNETMLKVRLHC